MGEPNCPFCGSNPKISYWKNTPKFSCTGDLCPIKGVKFTENEWSGRPVKLRPNVDQDAVQKAIEAFEAARVEQAANRHTGAFFRICMRAALEAALQSRPDVVEPITLVRVTGPGQVREGDRLLIVCGSQRKLRTETAKVVSYGGTPREEVIYRKKKNYYFITSIIGEKWHKAVFIIRAAIAEEQK